MGFVDIAFANKYKPPVLLPDGEEKMRIVKAVFGESKNSGNPMITVTLKSVRAANAKLVNMYLLFPDDADGMKGEYDNDRARQMNEFCEAFGIDVTSKLSVSDPTGEIPSWKGKEGWVYITQEPATEEFEASNRVKRCVRSK